MDPSHQNDSCYGISSSITSRVSPRGKNSQGGRKKTKQKTPLFFLTKLNDLHRGVANTSKWLTEGPIYSLSDSHMFQCDEGCPVSAEQPLLAWSWCPWCLTCALPVEAALDRKLLTLLQKPHSPDVLLALVPLDIYQASKLATTQAVGAAFDLFCCCF